MIFFSIDPGSLSLVQISLASICARKVGRKHLMLS